MVSQVLEDDASLRVLDAACALIVDGGPAAASVSAIASKAGLSRMTVYRKFDDRQAILSALLNQELGAIVSAAFSVQAPDQRERIACAVTSAVREINGHPLMVSVLEHDPGMVTQWVTQRLGASQRLAVDMLRDQIITGQPGTGDGSVRAGDPDALALTLVLVAQSFVFSSRLGSDAGQLYPLVMGYLA